MNQAQNNNHRFLYFYFNRYDPQKIGQAIPAHVQYWKNANLKGYVGGPFADRTGGSISFVASSLEEATAIIMQDPFVVEDLIDQKWIKEWIVEGERIVDELGTLTGELGRTTEKPGIPTE